MKRQFESPQDNWDSWRRGIIGLGEHSARKSYYPELQRQITELKQFRALLDQTNDAIFLFEASHGKLIDVNESACFQLGYSREKLLATAIDRFMSADIALRIRQIFFKKSTRVEAREIITANLHGHDGRSIPVEMNIQRVNLDNTIYIVAVGRDITERRKAEKALRESETKYRTIFEHCGNPLIIVDEDTTIALANKEFEELSGYSCLELEGQKSWTAFVANKDDLEMMRQYHYLRRIDPQLAPRDYEFQFVDRIGNLKDVVVAVTMIPETKRSLAAFMDMTERKRMEASLIRTERLSAVGEMASGVAHNFNNLLQIIMSAAEAATVKLNSSELPKCRKAIHSIVEASKRGVDIVKRIKDFTLVKTAAIDENKVFDLGTLIEEAVELTTPLWKDFTKLRKYCVSYTKPLGGTVKGNSSQISEVLVNIIKNSLEAMPRGGHLTISSEVQNGQIFVHIADSGVGISEENIPRIFQPFFTTKGSKSSGLGLSSSYGIIKRHQGEIIVQSAPGRGTTFSIILPLTAPTEKQKSKKLLADKGLPDRKIRFLIIDDEKNILRMMEMWFEDSHVEVYTANTAEKGLQAFGQIRFDVILCDLGMDDMNGWEVGKTVKDYCHASGIPKTPFMLYTGYDTVLDPNALEASGVDRVVKKPTPAEELLCIIYEVVCGR
jgi:two-component system cell cycle sensor histidine kinase/response regulator CckA